MANGRLWLVCRECGERKLLVKSWGASVEAWDDYGMPNWLHDHQLTCFAADGRLADEDGPYFTTEGE